jgi:hypothetical protein
MLAVDGVVHGLHLFGGDLTCELIGCGLDLGTAGERIFAHQRDGLIGREVVEIVGEDGEAEGADGAVRRVAGDDIDLVVGEGAVEQAEIHGAGRAGEVQVVCGGEAGQAIGARLELVTDAKAELRGDAGGVGDGVEIEATGVVGADDHGKGVLEAERRLDVDFVARFVEAADGGENAGGVALAGWGKRLLEDGGEGGSGVFDVGVDAASGEGLLADVAAGEVEATGYMLVGATFLRVDGFDLLGEEFAEDDLLGEIFCAERASYSRVQLTSMLDFAEKGIRELLAAQQQAIASAG